MKINPDKLKFKTIIHGALDYKFNARGPLLNGSEKGFAPGKPQKKSQTSCRIWTEVSFLQEGSAYTPLCF